MPGITAMLDRLSVCFKCRSESTSAADSEQKTKVGNVNKVVNINISPAQKDVVIHPQQKKVIHSSHKPTERQSECHLDEEAAKRPDCPRPLKAGNINNLDIIEVDNSIQET